ncbi:unnamed protein product, partial [Brenthis ino]
MKNKQYDYYAINYSDCFNIPVTPCPPRPPCPSIPTCPDHRFHRMGDKYPKLPSRRMGKKLRSTTNVTLPMHMLKGKRRYSPTGRKRNRRTKAYTPPQPCLSAQICNHTGTAICGIEINDKHNRIFLDECDMFEYNCDNHKAYYPTEFSNCLQSPQTTTTNLQTLSSTSIEVNTTTKETTKTSFPESDNVTKATVTEITQMPLNLTTVTVTSVTTSPTTTTTASTSSEPIHSTDTTAMTTNTLTTQLLTTTSTPIQTTIETTTETMTTSMTTNTLTTPSMITTSTPIQTTVETTTKMITKMSTIDDKNTTNATKLTSTTCTARPQNITTSQIKEKQDCCSSTPSIKETSVTTALTEATLTTIYEKNSIKTTTTETTSSKNQSVATLVTCEYPKYCDRPHTWETTAKGETRDFYQILKARYGNRVKILRDTTHWSRRMTPNVNDIDDNFQFGRHNEGRRLLVKGLYTSVTAPAHIVTVLTVTCETTMQYLIILVSIFAFTQARPTFIFTQPYALPGIEYVQSAPVVHAHPAVEQNAASEALLPPELLKSNAFYGNPAIAAGLARESWFAKKEMRVVEREAEKIPRQRIYDIVKSAGFLDRH